jgi:predicted Zn-dependent peptidase
MIVHYLSRNNKMCYSTKTNNFSLTKQGLSSFAITENSTRELLSKFIREQIENTKKELKEKSTIILLWF